MPMKRAAAYCRVSTDQEDQKNSLKAQEEYFRQHMEEHHYELVCIYADEGITGTKKKNRKEFLRMLEDAKKERFDTLFVKDVSRFARNTLDSLESVRMLKDHNISIVFINNQGILETSSELMFTIMSAMAQEESVNTSKRVKFGKEQNAKKGKVPNYVYGYDKKAGDFFNLSVNEEEAQVVRRIFRLYAEEGEGCFSIANRLNEEGRHTKRGYQWSQNAIARVIRNEIYIGRVINGKETTKEIYSCKRQKKSETEWIVVQNETLRIVTDDLFDQAQKILNRRKDTLALSKERQSNRHVFSTLIKCKHCQRSFRRIGNPSANTSVRWVCSNRNGNGVAACENAVRIDEDALLHEICKYLVQWLDHKKAYVQEAKKRYHRCCEDSSEGTRAVQSAQKELIRCQTKFKKLQEMYLNDLISMEDLKAQSIPVKKTQSEMEERLKGLEQRVLSETEIEKKLEEIFQGMDSILKSDGITNEMLKQVIEKIEVDGDGHVEVRLKKLACK